MGYLNDCLFGNWWGYLLDFVFGTLDNDGDICIIHIRAYRGMFA